MEHGDVAEGVGAEVGRPEQQVGGVVAVEAEAAFALRIQGDEGQRAVRRIGAHDVGGADAGLLQAVEQEVAEAVAREHAGEARVPAEPRGGDRHVGRRAAGERREARGEATLVEAVGVQVDQRLAETQDGSYGHAQPFPPVSGAAMLRMREPLSP